MFTHDRSFFDSLIKVALIFSGANGFNLIPRAFDSGGLTTNQVGDFGSEVEFHDTTGNSNWRLLIGAPRHGAAYDCDPNNKSECNRIDFSKCLKQAGDLLEKPEQRQYYFNETNSNLGLTISSRKLFDKTFESA